MDSFSKSKQAPNFERNRAGSITYIFSFIDCGVCFVVESMLLLLTRLQPWPRPATCWSLQKCRVIQLSSAQPGWFRIVLEALFVAAPFQLRVKKLEYKIWRRLLTRPETECLNHYILALGQFSKCFFSVLTFSPSFFWIHLCQTSTLLG